MSDAVKTYRRTIKANLRCFRTKRVQLLLRFDSLISAYLEDDPSPSTGRLITAFGTPEEMAKTLMSEVPANDQKLYERSRRLLLGTTVTFFALVISVLSIWLFTSLHTEEVHSNNIVYISEPSYCDGDLNVAQDESGQQEANETD